MKKSFVLVGSMLLVAALLASCNGGAQSSVISSSAALSSSATLSSSVSSTLTKKTVTLYEGSPNQSVQLDTYFEANNPDVPLLRLDKIGEFLAEMKGFSSHNTTLSLTGKLLTLTLGDGQTALFDFDQKTITFPNEEKFFARSGSSTSLNAFGGFPTDAEGKSMYFKLTKDPYIVDGHPMVADLGANAIPMILENGIGYIPLATFSDIFCNAFSFQFFYNGINAFISSSQRTALNDLYYSAPTGARSQSLADFTYHEFCLNGDFNYALKEKHGITTFDDFLTRAGRKADLSSTDPKVADAAIAYVTETDLDDNHSTVDAPSSYAGRDFAMNDPKYKGTSNTFWDKTFASLTAARTAAYPKGFLPYEEVGTTAFVTFDEFTGLSGDYYTTEPTAEDAAKDTFALIEYAHKKINADGIKSVVLDLTCNRGGAATAAAYVSSWMLGGATLHFSALLDGAKASFPMAADVNLDKTFDASDSVAGKKLYCLTSAISFSSGNLVPSVLKSSGKVTMVGQTSGGGACVIDGTCLADGTQFTFSGSHAVCTVKNGVYYDVDKGVDPDYPITDIANFYDRTMLAGYLATLK
jgi:hypothetical protein